MKGYAQTIKSLFFHSNIVAHSDFSNISQCIDVL